MEIINIHSHTDRTINVYVKEGEIFPVAISTIRVINITSVTLQSYTTAESSPRKATLVFKDNIGSNFLNIKSRFTLLKNSTIDLTKQMEKYMSSQTERTQVLSQYKGFIISRSNFIIKNIWIETALVNSKIELTLIKAVYQNTKNIKVSGVTLITKGSLFEASEPLNLNVENTEIDYKQIARGFYLISACNFTEASLMNSIIFTNVTVHETDTRMVDLDSSFIIFAGPANLTIANSHISVYGTDIEPYPPIQYNTISTCNPSDGVVQTFTIKNTKFSLPQNTEKTRFSEISVLISGSYSRPTNLVMSGNSFEGFIDNAMPVYQIYGNNRTSVSVQLHNISSSTFTQSLMHFSGIKLLQMENIMVSNVTKFGQIFIQMDLGKNWR